jgi:hypothetical protein
VSDGTDRGLRARRGASGAALLLLLATSGCASDAVATEPAPPAAAADSGVEDDSESIAEANARAVSRAPAALQKCLTRNDDVQEETDKAWHTQGRQQSHITIIKAVYRRIGVQHEYGGRRNDKVLKGFLGYGFDVRNHRLIMQLDPALIDIPEFRRWVNGVAKRASVGRSPRSRLTVTVQRGCFSAKQLDGLRKKLDKDGRWDARSGTSASAEPRTRRTRSSFNAALAPISSSTADAWISSDRRTIRASRWPGRPVAV